MQPPLRRLRLGWIPALLTLAITVLRLAGERLGWPARWFSNAAGGGSALVGIVWLVPVFGAWFGYRLARAGRAPARPGRALVLHLLGVVVFLAAFLKGIPALPLATDTRAGLIAQILAMGAAAALALPWAWLGWPALATTSLLYALLARVPVVVITWLGLHAAWGTHYEKFGPRDYAGFTPNEAAFWLGFTQLTIWPAFTLVFGGLCGTLVAIAGSRRPAREPASA